MVKVKGIIKGKLGYTVLICSYFSNNEIKRTIRSDRGEYTNFEVMESKECFSKPDSRMVVFFGNEDLSGVDKFEFV